MKAINFEGMPMSRTTANYVSIVHNELNVLWQSTYKALNEQYGAEQAEAIQSQDFAEAFAYMQKVFCTYIFDSINEDIELSAHK